MLIEYGAVAASRDERIRAAVAAGVSKHRAHQLTGVGRMTIDRIMAGKADGPATAQAGESAS
jgi:hypothetical protein